MILCTHNSGGVRKTSLVNMMINNSKSTPINAQTNDQNFSRPQKLSERSKKENYKTKTAIEQGEKQLQEHSEEGTLELMLTDTAFKHQKEVAKAFGYSQQNVASMAINYVNFYIQKSSISVTELLQSEDFLKKEEQRSKTQKIELTWEIEDTLKRVGLQDQPSECVMLGVDLLYKNNCQFDDPTLTPSNNESSNDKK
ncbi:hypothetical protein PN462_01045 [Spirulina sp. CS-785/01]|uniref:hypothetical protein n=1 Tax=Spirulina sp. CS-785/01 TaxID=3021716 RepID=UPI00232EF633|nr:hypothetical protein [Spirulina sp. CS-785/01]MDB9311669.1 hypothetical protein [Spirulina sp. CS-785/01]